MSVKSFLHSFAEELRTCYQAHKNVVDVTIDNLTRLEDPIDDLEDEVSVLQEDVKDIEGQLDNKYIISLDTTGYTSGSVTIWGESKTLYSKTLTTDKDGNALTNFTSGMNSDYPINISGSNSDFSKLYAFEIGNGSVTVYMTSAPSVAFNILIKEAI